MDGTEIGSLACVTLILVSCTSKPVTGDDLIGQFCGQHHLGHEYRLSLNADRTYDFKAIGRDSEESILEASGDFEIFGPPPVKRVNLRRFCFQPVSDCGDYPAQVNSSLGGPEIILDFPEENFVTLSACTRN